MTKLEEMTRAYVLNSRFGTPERAAANHAWWDGLDAGLREHMMKCMAEALWVIREADEAMTVAACREAAKEQVRPVAIHRTDVATVWVAAIDAIREGK